MNVQWHHDGTEVGLDLDHSDYAFEHVSHSHVRFELKDVVLTSALWRFLVGPILPLTVQEGQVDQVSREGREWGCLVTFCNKICIIHIYIHIHMCIYIYICIDMYIYMCIFTYTYVYVYENHNDD